MAMLHIIRNSGFTSSALTQCLDMILPQDSIVLIDDGCYNLNHTLLLKTLTEQRDITVYFISLHADARAQRTTNSLFIATTLTEVVALLFKHNNSITWS
ncbi:sulfurtransferase complex subunit TusB [Colwellia sp. C1TZA3]|uniref:sulfurtransferase complex subunit TusB n=1 Tax=Colwellia sp. C1TZA3 TaxID=2508879 RepID=UPI0011BA0449|nr:sulfurtransferase complex subunit TusB [Colwellia sp. C1TZA3]TWX73813.1 sulfurtransferase complex subunit TusB [Colwellia sp. C1TZA3]